LNSDGRNLIIDRRGLMLILSSPSGAGKSTISRALLEREDELAMSVSATTRPPRPGEVDGEHYYFISEAEYHRMVAAGEFLEHAKVFDNYYGTPRKPVEEALASGRDVLFDVDWQGARNIRQEARADQVSVFILPPSIQELERRLFERALDPEDVVRRRMATATDEMSHWGEYDYIVVNVDLDESVAAVQAILRAERLRRDRQIGLQGFVAAMAGEE
jgi:guanylate kinase